MNEIRAFDSAYPGSMSQRNDGYYVERNDHKSMAAALVELISSRDRELEDLRGAITQLEAENAELRVKLDAIYNAEPDAYGVEDSYGYYEAFDSELDAWNAGTSGQSPVLLIIKPAREGDKP